MELKNRINGVWDTVVGHRRWLHAHPELSGQEQDTAAYIAAALEDIGLSPTRNVGGHGVVAMIHGKPGGSCVGLRADFDALSIPEKTGLPYLPKIPVSAMPAATMCTLPCFWVPPRC